MATRPVSGGVEANCAICGAPPDPECPHEGERLQLALNQAMERWDGLHKIRCGRPGDQHNVRKLTEVTPKQVRARSRQEFDHTDLPHAPIGTHGCSPRLSADAALLHSLPSLQREPTTGSGSVPPSTLANPTRKSDTAAGSRPGLANVLPALSASSGLLLQLG